VIKEIVYSNTQKKSVRLLPYIMMLYSMMLVSTGPFVNKLISIGPLFTSAAVITFPFTFIIADIVAEVYGYSIARKMVWMGLFCQFIFALLAVLVVLLPYPMTTWNHNLAYHYVFGNLLEVYFSALISAPVGDFINIYLMSKFKILTRGKFFWCRSVLAIAIGQLAYTVICASLIFYKTLNPHDLLIMIITTYLVTIFYVFVLSVPGAFIAKLVKQFEHCDIYDYKTNFNPFRWNDDEEIA
jgi:uncharacterized integral membrane protein (TIGR00697 family)